MPRSYAQNAEDLFVLNRIKKGTVLEIGANQGVYLSNSKLLIENGWKAYLIEPGETYNDLKELHKDDPNVHTFNYGIAKESGRKTFWQSGEHEPGKGDIGLVSTTVPKEMDRWKGVEFKETEVEFKTFKEFWDSTGNTNFDFISIDVEGNDLEVLQQINLMAVGCKLLCIEWNGDQSLRNKFNNYCRKYGMKEVHRNAENIIYSI